MHGQITRAPASEDDDRIDLHQIMDFLVRRRLLIGFIAVMTMALALGSAFLLTPRYTSTAEILLDQASRSALGTELSGMDANSMAAAANIENQISIIESLNLLRRVVEKEGLVNDPEFGTQASGRSWSTAFWSLFGGTPATVEEKLPAGPGASSIPDDIRASIYRLRGALHVERVGRSYILQISVTSTDRDRAARLANAVADAFIVDQLETRFDAARRASDWLNDRLQRLRDALRRSEEAVSQFRTEHNLVSVGTRSLNEQQLSEVSAELVQVETEAAEKQAKYEQAKKILDDGGNLATLPDVIRSGVVTNLRSRHAEVTGREADLVTRYGERHPMVVNVRAERREVERQISAEINRIVANLENDYDVARTRAAAMAANVAAASGQNTSDNALAVKLRELERDASANRTLYETFLGQSKVTSEQSELDIRDARIITPAFPSGAPSFPKKSLFLAAGTALGLVLGIGLAALLDMLNAGFSSPRQLEEATGLPVLASVEWADFTEGEKTKGAIPILDFLTAKPLSRFSESIRSLRAGVQMSDVDNPPRVVEVTSASPSEGKTSIALAIAASAASSGKRVVLIDCDLRRPSITQQFGLDEKPGLVEWLAQAVSSEGLLHRHSASGIYVLGAGAKTQNPPDLLGSARMQHLIEQLRQNFDLVVMDAPPVGPVVDAAILAPVADKVLFVVRWNTTAREFVRHSIERIPGDRKICGIVLNMIDLRGAPKYGRYSYHSSAYYKKYYVG
ncbi:GumC family protein [Ancylobacter vacuolatus]|uniref:non-specific protein-tyrosine kinase n=1 Tax=Ancylobacter vacuolatus TaxID=223389 RepID=A0ABU0DNL6_9HYPH|nr:polysaccharide biosynthesis tyrosine autokinase [Ancylobacter vacuolatus]MDQ0350009.1 capsular exopolysaccharide synthesis family protein [Ancylobacter vacuolatus]